MTNTSLSHSDPTPPLFPVEHSLQRQIMLILSAVLISLILLISTPLIWVAIQIQRQASAREQQILVNQVAQTVAALLQNIQNNNLNLPQTTLNTTQTRLITTQILNLVDLTIADISRKVQNYYQEKSPLRKNTLHDILKLDRRIQGLGRFSLDARLQETYWQATEQASDQEENLTFFNRDSFRQASEGITSLDTLIIDAQNRPILIIAVPIFQANQVSEIMIIWVNIEHIWPYVTSLEVGQQGYLYIIDPQGQVVAAPAQFLTHLSDMPVYPQENRSYLGLEGERVIGQIAPIRNTPWRVVIEIPTWEAYERLRAIGILLGAILMFGLGLGILSSRLLSQWMLAPINTLQQGVVHISQGNLRHRIDLQRNDELGVLSTAINQMVETLEKTIEQLRDVSLHILSTQEMERKRIAHDIHDELGQTLTTLKLNLYILRQTIPENEHLASAQQLATEAQEKARTLSHELHPAMLDDLGLQPTLNWLIDRFEQRANIAISLDTILNEENLPTHLKNTLYRIITEALTNINKHAQAETVEITLHQTKTELRLDIQDDGVGIDSDRLKDTQSLGIAGMRERINLLQGNFSLESKPHQGTYIKIVLPF